MHRTLESSSQRQYYALLVLLSYLRSEIPNDTIQPPFTLSALQPTMTMTMLQSRRYLLFINMHAISSPLQLLQHLVDDYDLLEDNVDYDLSEDNVQQWYNHAHNKTLRALYSMRSMQQSPLLWSWYLSHYERWR